MILLNSKSLDNFCIYLSLQQSLCAEEGGSPLAFPLEIALGNKTKSQTLLASLMHQCNSREKREAGCCFQFSIGICSCSSSVKMYTRTAAVSKEIRRGKPPPSPTCLLFSCCPNAPRLIKAGCRAGQTREGEFLQIISWRLSKLSVFQEGTGAYNN